MANSIFVPKNNNSLLLKKNNVIDYSATSPINNKSFQSDANKVMKDISMLTNLNNTNSQKGGKKSKKSSKKGTKKETKKETKKRKGTKGGSMKGGKEKRKMPQALQDIHEIIKAIKGKDESVKGGPPIVKLVSNLIKKNNGSVEKAKNEAFDMLKSGELLRELTQIKDAMDRKRREKKKEKKQE